MNNQNDTIAAVATAPGVGAIGIVRISGPKTKTILKRIFSVGDKVVEEPRKVFLGDVAKGGEVIDSGLALYFKSPNSYTGEDSAELHLHGNPLVLQQVVDLAISSGARMAEPGEFTKRAFLNQKLDLAQAESVNDIIVANSTQAARMAESNLHGGLSQFVSETRGELVKLLATISANLDFSEEETPDVDSKQVLSSIQEIKQRLDEAVRAAETSQVVRQGITAAIIGVPNVGKSSLLNAISGQEKAIVTEVAGTTRDIVEADVLAQGVLVRLIDTAGIREATDKVETVGIDRSKQAIKDADIILFTAHTQADIDSIKPEIDKHSDKPIIGVVTKSDEGVEILDWGSEVEEIVETSAEDKTGIEALLRNIYNNVVGEGWSESSLSANSRHLENLHQTSQNLAQAIKSAKSNQPLDLLAADLQEAIDSLDNILGIHTSDEVINSIFSNFCIGK